MSATRLDIARSFITLDPAWWSPPLGFGPIYAVIQATLRSHFLLDAQLRPTPIYRNRGLRERSVATEQLAEAFTHWFAQRHMDIDVLTPYDRFGGTTALAAIAAPYPKPSPVGYRRPNLKGETSSPDFVGLAGADRHVVESKGIAAFGPAGVAGKDVRRARNKGFFQVCRVATVDGENPVSRTVCVFSFETTAMWGEVTDPGPIDRFDLPLDLPELLRRYYALVLHPEFERLSREGEGSFVELETGAGIRFGVHKAVLKRLRSMRARDDAQELLHLLRELRTERRSLETESVGPDGLRLRRSDPVAGYPWTLA